MTVKITLGIAKEVRRSHALLTSVRQFKHAKTVDPLTPTPSARAVQEQLTTLRIKEELISGRLELVRRIVKSRHPP